MFDKKEVFVLSNNVVKTCPFCGCNEIGVSVVIDNGSNLEPHKTTGYSLYCTNCLVEQGAIYVTEKEAIETWNKRIKDER
jgi:Lar family restriction alleviation protein